MRNYNILIADDEKVKTQLLTNYINQSIKNTQIHCVENGEMAIRIINNIKFDLIIMDWEMPKMDGVEATKIIKLNSSNLNCPILMITGKYKSIKNELDALKAGVDQFMTFPFQVSEFKGNVIKLLGKQFLKQENRCRINHSLF